MIAIPGPPWQRLQVNLGKIQAAISAVLAKIYGKASQLERSSRVENIYNELGKQLKDTSDSKAILNSIEKKKLNGRGKQNLVLLKLEVRSEAVESGA